MGLFNKLVGAGLNMVEKATTEESIAKAKNILNKAEDKLGDAATALNKQIAERNQKAAEAQAASTPSAPPVFTPASGYASLSCREKLLQVLKEEFPGYTVYENVSPTYIGGKGKFMNYSIGVYQNDVPKLFLMIIGKTTCTHREYRFSKEQAAAAGIPMINFIGHYPNERTYVVNRLHKYL